MTMNFGNSAWIWLPALAAIFILIFYRRARRLIGHQCYRERRMRRRIVFLSIILIIALGSLIQGEHLATGLGSAALGLALGVLIAGVALRITQMGDDEQGVWYVPNRYLGIALLLLLVARYTYEYVEISPQIRQAILIASQNPQARVVVPAQPILHAVLFLVLGYYLSYYGGIALRARRIMQTERPSLDN